MDNTRPNNARRNAISLCKRTLGTWGSTDPVSRQVLPSIRPKRMCVMDVGATCTSGAERPGSGYPIPTLVLGNRVASQVLLLAGGRLLT